MKKKEKPSLLTRRQKNLIHGVILACIIIAFLFEGAKFADILFFALSALTEGA